jgi:hypothetical protein
MIAAKATKTAPAANAIEAGMLKPLRTEVVGEGGEGCQVELFSTNLRIEVEPRQRRLNARSLDAECEREAIC